MSTPSHSEGVPAAQRRKQRLEALLEAAPDATLIVDQHGTILMANAQAEQLFGYEPSELIGLQIDTLVPAHYRDAHQRHREAFAAEPRVRSMGSNLRIAACRKDGSEFSIEIRLNPIAAEDGHWIAAAVRDISERELRHELEQQNERSAAAGRLKTMFLANMSHELRTPLNAVIGFAQLLHDELVGTLNDQQREFLQDILTSAQHLLSLINGMLDVASIDAGRMDFQPTTFALGPVLSEVRNSMRVLAAQRQLQLLLVLDPTLSQVTTDALKLKQVLLNFVANAIKFTPQGGRIHIRAEREGADGFRVAVEDTGAGIAPDQMHRLFVEFQQLDFDGARRREGTGLGLALSKRIVEAQGGHVGVSSVLGQGSVFYAVLPRALPEQSREDEAS